MKKTTTRGPAPIKVLRDAVHNLLSIDPALRPLTADGMPGGLVEFPSTEKREFIIIGDLHANVRNLRAILEHSDNREKVRQGTAVLLFLGDAVHSHRSGLTYAMDSSIEIMDIVLGLINEFPGSVFYLLGNHDSFAPELSALGVQQGLLYREALLKARGIQYVQLMQELFEALPLFIAHSHFLAVHAGPARGGVTRNELVNVRRFDNYLRQLTWNKLNETRSPPSIKEYGPEDLDETRRLLGYAKDVPIFVGGGEDSIRIDPLGCHDHVIIHAALDTTCPYVSVHGSSAYTVKYADPGLGR